MDPNGNMSKTDSLAKSSNGRIELDLGQIDLDFDFKFADDLVTEAELEQDQRAETDLLGELNLKNQNELLVGGGKIVKHSSMAIESDILAAFESITNRQRETLTSTFLSPVEQTLQPTKPASIVFRPPHSPLRSKGKSIYNRPKPTPLKSTSALTNSFSTRKEPEKRDSKQSREEREIETIINADFSVTAPHNNNAVNGLVTMPYRSEEMNEKTIVPTVSSSFSSQQTRKSISLSHNSSVPLSDRNLPSATAAILQIEDELKVTPYQEPTLPLSPTVDNSYRRSNLGLVENARMSKKTHRDSHCSEMSEGNSQNSEKIADDFQSPENTDNGKIQEQKKETSTYFSALTLSSWTKKNKKATLLLSPRRVSSAKTESQGSMFQLFRKKEQRSSMPPQRTDSGHGQENRNGYSASYSDYPNDISKNSGVGEYEGRGEYVSRLDPKGGVNFSSSNGRIEFELNASGIGFEENIFSQDVLGALDLSPNSHASVNSKPVSVLLPTSSSKENKHLSMSIENDILAAFEFISRGEDFPDRKTEASMSTSVSTPASSSLSASSSGMIGPTTGLLTKSIYGRSKPAPSVPQLKFGSAPQSESRYTSSYSAQQQSVYPSPSLQVKTQGVSATPAKASSQPAPVPKFNRSQKQATLKNQEFDLEISREAEQARKIELAKAIYFRENGGNSEALSTEVGDDGIRKSRNNIQRQRLQLSKPQTSFAETVNSSGESDSDDQVLGRFQQPASISKNIGFIDKRSNSAQSISNLHQPNGNTLKKDTSFLVRNGRRSESQEQKTNRPGSIRSLNGIALGTEHADISTNSILVNSPVLPDYLQTSPQQYQPHSQQHQQQPQYQHFTQLQQQQQQQLLQQLQQSRAKSPLSPPMSAKVQSQTTSPMSLPVGVVNPTTLAHLQHQAQVKQLTEAQILQQQQQNAMMTYLAQMAVVQQTQMAALLAQQQQQQHQAILQQQQPASVVVGVARALDTPAGLALKGIAGVPEERKKKKHHSHKKALKEDETREPLSSTQPENGTKNEDDAGGNVVIEEKA
ncbi:hypothetical protein HK100_008262 [Physocladia obscura]|uniref:Uncharacterized protein n=1 Tax=Physocladia obscura TaxID=109957 RepID=A0AAD5XIN0_9FUNG|nr:hypothetical protein HK100_008262 [Physocladia obscura]